MNKNWYAVITASVLYDKKITDRQKLLIAAISNMSNEQGYCFASNAHFAEMFSVSERSIQNDIKHLVDIGYVGRIIKINDKKEVEYRSLIITENTKNRVVKNSSPGGEADCAYNIHHQHIEKSISTPLDSQAGMKKYKDHSKEINDLCDQFLEEVKNGEHKQATELWKIQNNISGFDLKHLMEDFRTNLITQNKLHKNTLELRKHFYNFINRKQRT